MVRQLRAWVGRVASGETKDAKADRQDLIQAVGTLLSDGLLPDIALEPLRGLMEPSHFISDQKMEQASLFVLCLSEAQRKKCTENFPRAVLVIKEPDSATRRGLRWLTKGWEVPPNFPSGPKDESNPLLDCPDFAKCYLVALGQAACEPDGARSPEPRRKASLEKWELANVVQAYGTLAQATLGAPWFGPQQPVILTEADTLVPSSEKVFAGVDERVRALLTDQSPEQCLAHAVLKGFSDPTRARMIHGLGLMRDEAKDIVEAYTTEEPTRPYPLKAEHRQLLITSVQRWCAAQFEAGAFTPEIGDCRVEHVRRIERRTTFAQTNHSRIENVAMWLRLSEPPVLFVTDDGADQLESELLGLLDAEERDRLEKQKVRFEKEAEGARKLIDRVARDQQETALGYYWQVSSDTQFRQEDAERREKGLGVAERWKAFVRDPHRIKSLIKKQTIDVGYGADTIVRELLQNADDAYRGVQPPAGEAAWIEFTCKGNALVVTHGGRRFNERMENIERDDVGQICRMGGSEKSSEHEIGRFGLGFKSVFAITPEPVILSHPFYFRIKHLLVPQWEEPRLHLASGSERRTWVQAPRLTRFILQVSPDRRDELDKLAARLRKGQELRLTDLLFLRNLRRATALVDGDTRELVRTDQDESSTAIPRPEMVRGRAVSRQIRSLQMTEGRARPKAQAFLVFTQKVQAQVPTGTGPETRELECSVAFPWDAQRNCFAKLPEGTHSMLHLFLPTPEETGLPFLIHGEFLTTLGRTTIEGKHECNGALAVALARLVQETLRAALNTWERNTDKLLSVYKVIPAPSEDFWQSAWLDCIRHAFVALLDRDERVVLTQGGDLAKPTECRLGNPLVHQFYGAVGATLAPNCNLRPLVHEEIHSLIGKIQRRPGGKNPVKTLTSPELAHELFPDNLGRGEAIRRCKAVLQFLFEQQNDKDGAKTGERGSLLNELSALRCFPGSGSTVACPKDLLPQKPPKGSQTWAEIDLIAGNDKALRQWILENFKWKQILQASEDEDEENDEGCDQILLGRAEQEFLWQRNLKCVAEWWTTKLPPAERATIIDRYGLTGDRCFALLGLGTVPGPRRAEMLRKALHEDTEEHRRIWFRVLCFANVGQSGRRFEEGIQFLEQFDTNFRGFDRLWEAVGTAISKDVFGALVREALDAVILDRDRDWTFFWRRLYDFVKIRELLTERGFIDGFWDVAEHHPTELVQYLHRGVYPGGRAGHRGLGESLSSQAFFVCREAFRLGLITAPEARQNCYFPNRHLLRFLEAHFAPVSADVWLTFEKYQGISYNLHKDVERFTESGDFMNAFDIPLFYLAGGGGVGGGYPELACQGNPERVRELLANM